MQKANHWCLKCPLLKPLNLHGQATWDRVDPHLHLHVWNLSWVFVDIMLYTHSLKELEKRWTSSARKETESQVGAGGASPKPPKQVAWGWDKNKSPCWVCGLAFIAPSCYLWGHLISHSNFPLKTPSRWLCRLPASWIKASDSSVFHQIARFPSEWSPWLTPIKTELAGLPRGPVAKTLRSQCRGTGFNTWSGN